MFRKCSVLSCLAVVLAVLLTLFGAIDGRYVQHFAAAGQGSVLDPRPDDTIFRFEMRQTPFDFGSDNDSLEPVAGYPKAFAWPAGE